MQGKKKIANTQLQKVRLTSMGYELGTGKYFGVGMAVYRYIFDDGQNIEIGHLRAANREVAKNAVKAVLIGWGFAPVFYR